ncbi:MAG: Ig-like domain-containing protein [Bacteroidales bacterium]|nr:Ig-like domain-containing protein [Bacteroidales bacterium]
MRRINFVLAFFLLFTVNSVAQQLAFPGAEGYGKYTTGGRGGAVYEVTNLNASGSGSLEEALSASGARTVVFRVSGIIEGNFKIENDKITIAGQTAPGDGICIKGSLSVAASDVIIRYIRVRANPTEETDAIGGRYEKNIIVDHVSASWSSDEVMSFYHNENVTIQWCMVTEACEKAGEGHRFGGIWGNPYGTYHHNLIAHNDSRNPRWASGCGYNDYRNNVLYNWGYNSCYGAEAQQDGKPQFYFSTINMIANYYKSGPGTQPGVKSRIAQPSTRDGEADAGKWWVSNNVVVGYPTVTTDNWKGFASNESYFRLSEPWDAMPINQQSPEEAYNFVLAHAGCSKPNRDTIDKRIINEVRTGTATYGSNGIITVPGDVGGWPFLASGTPPVDSDHDGMPNNWEKDNGLDTANADDRNIVGADGYTMLEVYLNCLAIYDTVSVTGITLNQNSVTLNINEKTQLSVIISPFNATNQIVTWSSSDNSVVTVDETGLVTAISVGSAVITAATQDRDFIDTANITVISSTSIQITTSDKKIYIYPIPFSNQLNIQYETESDESVDIMLFDATGKMVFYKKSLGVNQQLDLTDLDEGIYMLKLVGPSISVVKSVIKI